MKKRVGYKIAGLESIKGDAGFILVSQTLLTSAPPTAFFFSAILRHVIVFLLVTECLYIFTYKHRQNHNAKQ